MNRADQASRALAVPKAIRLRERARSLKGQAEDLFKRADALLAQAERVEAEESKRKNRSEDANRAIAPKHLKIGSEIHRIAREVGGVDDLEIVRQQSGIEGAYLADRVGYESPKG